MGEVWIRSYNTLSKLYVHIHDILCKIIQLKKNFSKETSRLITERNKIRRCRTNKNGLIMDWLSSVQRRRRRINSRKTLRHMNCSIKSERESNSVSISKINVTKKNRILSWYQRGIVKCKRWTNCMKNDGFINYTSEIYRVTIQDRIEKVSSVWRDSVKIRTWMDDNTININ